jgi:hypothetical protein
MKRRRRLRRLAPDQELIRRRAAGEPLRELASDYGVAHTTLGRYFERPELAKHTRQAATTKRRRRLRRAGRRPPPISTLSGKAMPPLRQYFLRV